MTNDEQVLDHTRQCKWAEDANAKDDSRFSFTSMLRILRWRMLVELQEQGEQEHHDVLGLGAVTGAVVGAAIGAVGAVG
jgi:hypothetical protein